MIDNGAFFSQNYCKDIQVTLMKTTDLIQVNTLFEIIYKL